MEVFKIKLHSSVDLITNSSTVIFTYSEGSLPAIKELINEMLKVFDKKETFDDIFYAETFLEDDDYYLESSDYPQELKKGEWKQVIENFNNFKLSILKGEIEKPQWMINVEENLLYDYYRRSTTLDLQAKDEKYSELANKLLKYLYSTYHEATIDG
jgi:hypothetical protein